MAKPDTSADRAYMLDVKCAASPEFREQNRDDPSLFNVGLVVGGSGLAGKVPVVAADLANLSEWFGLYMKRRHAMQGTNTDLLSVEVPADITLDTLEQVIAALYSGKIVLGPDNLQEVLLAARSMLMPVVEQPCKRYIVDSLDGCSSDWATYLHSMTTALSMDDMTEAVIVYMVKAALDDGPFHRPLYAALAALPNTEDRLRLLNFGVTLRFQTDGWSQAVLAVLLMRLDQFGRLGFGHASRKRARTSAVDGSNSTAVDGSSSTAVDDSSTTTADAALDVAALLQHVAWDSLHMYEVKALSLQALSCQHDTPAVAAFKHALLQQSSQRLDRGSIDAHPARPYLIGHLNVADLALQQTDKVLVPKGNVQTVAVAGAAPISFFVRCNGRAWGVYVTAPRRMLLRDTQVAAITLYALGPTVRLGCTLVPNGALRGDEQALGYASVVSMLLKDGISLGEQLVIGATLRPAV